MIPYSEKEEKVLLEELCHEIPDHDTNEQLRDTPVTSMLQTFFDLEFEQKFRALLSAIYRRLPAF